MRIPEKLSRRVYLGLLGALFLAIAVVPVVAALWQSVWVEGEFSPAAYRDILTEKRQIGLLLNSVCISFGTTIFAGILGVTCGLLLEYIRIPTRRFLLYATAVPFLIPPYVAATAWVDLLGNNGWISRLLRDWFGLANPNLYSLAGVIFVSGLCYYPIVAFITAASLRRLDRRLEEAGEMVHTQGRVFLNITLPLTAPGILSSAVIVFLLSLLGFAVPSLLQVPVYPVESFDRYSAFYDLPGSIAQSMPTLLMGLGALLLWFRYIRPRRAWLSGRQRSLCPERGGKVLRVGGVIFCWAVVIVAAVLPMAVIFVRSLPMGSYIEAFQTAKGELLTSLLVATLSATVVCWMGFSLLALVHGRLRETFLHVGSLLPFLLSGPVLGVALILVWNRPGVLQAMYDSVAILVIANVARFLFVADAGLVSALKDIDPGIREAASIAGVSWRRQLTGLLFPLCRPAVVATWGLCFLFSFAEVDASVLVCPPGWTTLPVRLFSLMHYGPGRYVAALSTLTVMIILAAAALIARTYMAAKEHTDAHR